ncbi:hypothetical protein CC85DRAFT_262114 [Cutaneotrichosporon oleaginosum]|uniref:Protein FRG1 n=1 Tax=Cutaneotrichosporon oleaginosum TaxID=879819 RepID=A0A0J0XJQ8_9TREE|nr:uncharacterized protein CC85DRAFT_262114 [Cutaneotrichosporon oleaginosum]KLT41332.1 hypothetical protein CC85DRAFT_262114 [Cutaneotrichosporon oleaginosum]TXT06277.1 hypothetical protein COLE_05608 [Cutaneotrichosporon oleaginosum]
MPEVVSKKLKFKGDKPKKKKRSHARPADELDALAAEDPSGWMFPTTVDEVAGPTFILLPTEPLTCLAWDSARQKVYAAPLDVPQAPEGANDLSSSEVLSLIEPSDINHVWVVSRLAGSEDIISLRTSNGTFLTATPGGQLSASTPSRGPLEGFTPLLSTGELFPSFSLKTSSGKYLSVPRSDKETILAKKAELRADADEVGSFEGLRVKCQREHILKARVAAIAGRAGGEGKTRLLERGGPSLGSVEDELKRNTQYQAWGAGRHHVSSGDRNDLKRAKREGRIAEAMLDRRAAMKSDRYAK